MEEKKVQREGADIAGSIKNEVSWSPFIQKLK